MAWVSLQVAAVALLLLAASAVAQTCPNSGQLVHSAVVDGAPATYTGADVDLDAVNNFAFTTAADTEGVVYSLEISVSSDITLCPLFPMVFQAEQCACATPAICDSTLAEGAPAVTSGVYSGVQSIFVEANTVEQLYPMMPSTTYYVAFWIISGCGIVPSSSVSLTVTTSPITVADDGVVVQDMPFYASASGSVEALAFLSVPTAGMDASIDGVKVTLAPTSPNLPEDDFLDCVYFSDEQASLVESNWWESYTCNPDYNRNPFSFVVELPGNLASVPAVALDLAMTVRDAGTYNVTYEFEYSCGDCGENTVCDGSTGTCLCAPGWGLDGAFNCTVPIDCQGNTTVPCYIEDGTASKTCANNLWGPCTLIECDSGFVATAWGADNSTQQCIAETAAGPGLTILWICLGIVLVYAVYGAVGAVVYFYQRHKRLGTAVKSYDVEEDYDSTVY